MTDFSKLRIRDCLTYKDLNVKTDTDLSATECTAKTHT